MSDFKDTPISLGEHRAYRNDDCMAWTPREVLLSLLRDIDSGKLSPTGLIVAFVSREAEKTRTGMRRSGMSLLETVGLIEAIQYDLLLPP